jgi:hypothetical protein
VAADADQLARPGETAPARTADGEDWAASAADAIERAVASVRAKTADPLERVVRLAVYGLLAAVVGVAIVVLLTAAAVRGLVELIDLAWQREVWLAHLLLGGIFLLAGLFAWRKRTAKTMKV